MSPNESGTSSQHCYGLYLITVINFIAVIIHYSNMRTIAPLTNYSLLTVRKYRGSGEDKSKGTVGANPSEANLTRSKEGREEGQNQPSLANALCGAPCEAGRALACSKPQGIMLIHPDQCNAVGQFEQLLCKWPQIQKYWLRLSAHPSDCRQEPHQCKFLRTQADSRNQNSF